MKKIVLLCAAGMSTSMLVKKMEEAAAAMNFEADIAAYSVSEVKEVTKDADLVLLGPQVRYQLSKIKEDVSCPVEAIYMAAYGMMDGKAVMKRAVELIGE